MTDKLQLKALVCGASQGIGEAVAQVLARDGFQVVLLARNEKKLQAVVDDLPGEGHKIIAVDLGDHNELHSKIYQELEVGPFHVLVNNAGGPKAGSLLLSQKEEFVRGFDEHILVAHILAQMLVPGMKEEKYGRIINIISTSVKVPLSNLGVSNTVRGAMASWAKSLANEVGAYGITVNNVLPGFTLTGRFDALVTGAASRMQITEEALRDQWLATVPLGRFALPEEIAEVVAFLAGPKAAYVSGVNLPVDGGRTPSL
jgi:3-oxoacyl-[acyl-carrier protein] reductase